MYLITLSKTEIEAMGGLEPIPDLKVGDKLKLKDWAAPSQIFPKPGQIVEVFSLDMPHQPSDAGLPVRRYDFTAIFKDEADGEIIEYAFDSRKFVRAE